MPEVMKNKRRRLFGQATGMDPCDKHRGDGMGVGMGGLNTGVL